MIQVIADSIALHGLITAYKINVVPITSDNGFTAYDGTVVNPVKGHKTVIDCTLDKVPHAVAQSIAAIVSMDEFDLTYTTPIEITKKFRCTKYDAVPKNSDPRQKNPLVTGNITWTISMTLESTDTGASSGGGL